MCPDIGEQKISTTYDCIRHLIVTFLLIGHVATSNLFISSFLYLRPVWQWKLRTTNKQRDFTYLWCHLVVCLQLRNRWCLICSDPCGNSAQLHHTYSQTRLYRTAQDRLVLFFITGVRYNRISMCSKMTNLPKISVRYNRVFAIIECSL